MVRNCMEMRYKRMVLRRVLLCHPCLLESCHFFQYLHPGLDESHGEGCSGSLSQTELQVEDRFGAQMFQHELVSDFHGTVGSEDVLFYVGMHLCRDERTGSGDKTVDHHGNPVGGTADDESGDTRYFQAADFGQHVEGIGGIGAVYFQGAFYDAHLVLQGRIVDPGSPVRDFPDGHSRDCGNDGGGGCRVADSHLAGPCHGNTLFFAPVGKGNPRFNSRNGLFAGHCRTLSEVPCSPGDFSVDETGGVPEIMIYSDVDHADLDPGVTGENIDTRATSEEIEHHLWRHLFRESGHAFFNDAVVSGEGEDDLLFAIRIKGAGNGGKTSGELFKPAEGTERLGLVVQFRLCLVQ
jgi:hypothetical protein